ncbi:MAG: C69 family dipeptidase [Candidatus Marinimicrobia bacterium]|nr:C69 family dipeptidase [Candidatus Neomarinimicrobiota bacterium]
MLKTLLNLSIFYLCGALIYPCTTILIGKGLTADKSIIHAHNEDMGNLTVGRLWRVNDFSSENDSTWVPYVTIQNTGKKLAYWASGNTKQINKDELNQTMLPYDNILVGMNESGLTMSCNWMYSKEESLENMGIRRYAIRQLILERAATAREAVELISSFIDTYGQADWSGLTYVLADPNEGWIVETTTHNWVAKKLKDHEIIAVANRYTIGEEFDLSSKNLIQNAIEKGWYKPKDGPFNFKLAYGDSEFMSEQYDSEREVRVETLLEEKFGKIKPEDLMTILRDRFHNSDGYTPPTSFEPDRITCRSKNAKRPICTNLCQSSFVAHLRPNLPREFGPVFWYTMATPAYGPYFPLYPFGSKIVTSFTLDDSDEQNTTAWWVYRHLQQKVDISNAETIKSIRNQTESVTSAFISEQELWENKVQKQIANGNFKRANQLLNLFSNRSARKSLHHSKTILKRIN